MRKIVIPLLLVLCVYSCQKEDVQIEEAATQSSNTTSKNFAIDDTYSQREIMEINLRWAAYIAGAILKNNPVVQQQIQQLLQNGNRVIKLNDLLVENTAFNMSFRGYISENMGSDNQIEPNGDKSRPNPPPQGLGNGHAPYVTQFVNYILHQNCIELYFPKSMNYVGKYSIISTGHSMTSENSNKGIIRYYNEIPVSDDDIYYSTDYIFVDDTYVQNNINIIIARPYRNLQETIYQINCNYTQYNDIEDFKDFLGY